MILILFRAKANNEKKPNSFGRTLYDNKFDNKFANAFYASVNSRIFYSFSFIRLFFRCVIYAH